MSDWQEVETDWWQRGFLLGHWIAMTAMWWWSWYQTWWFFGGFGLGEVFFTAVLVVNWKRTMVGPREWHDYR